MVKIKKGSIFCKDQSFRESVRMKGLEPPRLAAPDPKSGVATNYTTSASDLWYKGSAFFLICKFSVKKS